MTAKKRLGEMLIELGIIDETQLKAALGHQRQWGVRIGQALVDLKLASEADIVRALSLKFGCEVARLDALEPYALEQALALLPRDFAHHNNVFPMAADTQSVTVAMSDPTNLAVVDEIRFRTGRKVKVCIGGDREVAEALRQHYPGDQAVEAIALDLEADEGEEAEAVYDPFGGGSKDALEAFFGAGPEPAPAPASAAPPGPAASPFAVSTAVSPARAAPDPAAQAPTVQASAPGRAAPATGPAPQKAPAGPPAPASDPAARPTRPVPVPPGVPAPTPAAGPTGAPSAPGAPRPPAPSGTPAAAPSRRPTGTAAPAAALSPGPPAPAQPAPRPPAPAGAPAPHRPPVAQGAPPAAARAAALPELERAPGRAVPPARGAAAPPSPGREPVLSTEVAREPAEGRPVRRELTAREIEILEALGRLAAGGHAEPEIVKPTQAMAAAIRLLLRKGVMTEQEFLDELGKR